MRQEHRRRQLLHSVDSDDQELRSQDRERGGVRQQDTRGDAQTPLILLPRRQTQPDWSHEQVRRAHQVLSQVPDHPIVQERARPREYPD